MCLIAWNWQPGTERPLLLIANRDEFFARPSAPLHDWDDAPILAGRDLQGGGTWLGVSRSGRVAALTNYRDPATHRPDAPTRGTLVSHFLQGTDSAADYLQALLPSAAHYNPFNLLVYDGRALMGLQSRNAQVLSFPAGLGAVSNADFHTPWPKLRQLRAGLQRLLSAGTPTDAELFALLQDRRTAPPAELPSTGVSAALELGLSAVFVALPGYGTRASTVLRVMQGAVSVSERSFDAQGEIGRAQSSHVLSVDSSIIDSC